MDLAGDGQPDLVVLDGPMPGLYEHDGNEGWQPFRPFTSRLNRDMRDPNLKFVDLDGDGHADVLITEDDAFVWHASLAEDGFGPARRVHQALDEENGPRLVFADGTQSIYLADLSGDGLTDLVRIRNGEVCYWPNLGYGRFGAKVTMDQRAMVRRPGPVRPQAHPAGRHRRHRHHRHHLPAPRRRAPLLQPVRQQLERSRRPLRVFPRVDDLVAITPTDLLGNGTACLVWSSPLPGDARRPMRYVDLMGGQKPHLLVRTINNLGAETVVQYSPPPSSIYRTNATATPGSPGCRSRHVVERVETFGRLSRNRFVTRYAYHHGYFDGVEREFRGFGMVEQIDTEEIGVLGKDGAPASQ